MLTSYLDSIKLFIHPRVMTMLFLGFSAGVPILLIFSTLGLWLNEAGVAKSTITYFSWAALGYSFKFVWAPLVDRLPLPVLTKTLGRRRAWMLVSQLAIMGAILLMASVDPKAGIDGLTIMAYGAVLLGFSSATQDIVIDAYRIESADKDMQSMLSATYIAGYRIGMLVAGAGGLFIASYLGSTKALYSYDAWSGTYMIMAAVMLIGVVTTLIISEPDTKRQETEYSTTDYARFFLLFLSIVIAFIFVYVTTGKNLHGFLFNVVYFLRVIFSLIISYVSTVLLVKIYKAKIVKFDLDKYIGTLIVSLFFGMIVIYILTNTKTFSLVFFGDLVQYFSISNSGKTLSGSLAEVFSNKNLSGFIAGTLHMLIALLGAFIVAKILIAIHIVNRSMVEDTYIEPVKDFFNRYGMSVAVLLLAVIGLYRVSDIVLGVMANIFYQDIGFSKLDIAGASKTFGLLMTIAGGFAGGLLANRIGVFKVLFLGATLSAITNLLFILLEYVGYDNSWWHVSVVIFDFTMPILDSAVYWLLEFKIHLMLYATISMDNLSAGIATTAFIAFLSSLTNIKFTAVQYAIFSSLMTLMPKYMVVTQAP